jgi:hypothetical protein
MLEALKNLIYRVSAYQFAHTDGTPNEIARRLYPGKGQDQLRAAYVKAAEEAKQQAEAKQSNEAGDDWGR